MKELFCLIIGFVLGCVISIKTPVVSSFVGDKTIKGTEKVVSTFKEATNK